MTNPTVGLSSTLKISVTAAIDTVMGSASMVSYTGPQRRGRALNHASKMVIASVMGTLMPMSLSVLAMAMENSRREKR